MAYNPNMYVSGPDQQQLLPGRQATVTPSYNPSDLQFPFSQFEDMEDPSLMAAAAAAHYRVPSQPSDPQQLMQEAHGDVTASYNPSELAFDFSPFESPSLMTAAPSHPFQGQLAANSPDPMLGAVYFASQQQPPPQQQQQQQTVMNPAQMGAANKQMQQNGAMYGGPDGGSAAGGDWRVNNSPLYALEQYPPGYLGVPGQFQPQQPQQHRGSLAAQGQAVPQQQQPAMRQQMISVGPSADIIDIVPPRSLSVDNSAEAVEKKPKATRKKKLQPVAASPLPPPPPPMPVPGASHMMMDMERYIIFDANWLADTTFPPNGSVSLTYEPAFAPTSQKSPNSVNSPDIAASPSTAAASSSGKKAAAAKPKTTTKMKQPPIVAPPDPISQMKDRMIQAIDDDDITVTKALSACWQEMKAITDDDKDGDEKRIAWLKTIFDNGDDELFRMMTGISQIIKRIRKWMVDAWREDKVSVVILHGLQVYQKLQLNEEDLEEFKLKSVLNTFAKNARDEKAATNILSRAAKFTAKINEVKKAEAKAKADAAVKSTIKSTADSKTIDRLIDAKPISGISKSDSADILKDAAKIASQASEESKSAKRKPDPQDEDHPNKRLATNPTDKSKVQLMIAPEGKPSTAAAAAKNKSSNEGFFANIQKASKPKPAAPAPQPGGFTSIFDLLKEREAANAAAKSAATTEKPAPVVKKKKSVRWKPDEELKEIRIFQTELPEGEDGYDPMEIEGGMDAGLVKAKVRANLKEEAQALKNRKFDDYDDDFEIEWDTLTPIQVHWPSDMLRDTCFKRMGEQTAESVEAQKQLERERNVLAVHYSMSHPPPPTPFELPSVNEVQAPDGGYWEANLLYPPPGWRRERNYLYGDSYQKKHMAKAILANLGVGQAAAAPAPTPTPQAAVPEATKQNQLASILAELQKLAPQPAVAAAAPTPQPPVPPQPAATPTPAPAPANPLASNPLLALLGMQGQTAQPQATAQPQLDLSKALQQLAQQAPQPQPQPQQPQINPLAGIPFPFPPIPPQPGQAPAFPFSMPFPPPLPGQNPLEFMAMYQALMAGAPLPQPQQPPQQPAQYGQLNDVLANLINPAAPTTTDTNMADDSTNYQPPDAPAADRVHQDTHANNTNTNNNNNGNSNAKHADNNNNNNHGNNNNNHGGGGGNNKEGKGSWSKFGKKKKNFQQHQQPYGKKDKGDKGDSRRVCAFWQAGNCLKKDDCQYSHDGPPGQGGTEQADQIRQHLYGKEDGGGGGGPRGGHEKKHKKFKKRGFIGGSGSAADTAAASASNDWNGEMEY
ncbi:hypothetical protein ABW21_db0200012 [Orbilia brochopaga]|nr:hypothetical protein ABW21_db0200012 [Drechslerella brochopaga]